MITQTAEATRAYLKEHAARALDGSLTIEEVISAVQEAVPDATRGQILHAIGSYGPIGEGDWIWEKRAQGDGPIRSWFYSPSRGTEVA